MAENLLDLFREYRMNICDGRFLILDTPVKPIVLNTFILFKKILEEKYGDEVKDIFYLAGKLQAKAFGQREIELRQFRKDDYTLQKLLKLSELFGLGVLEIARINSENTEILFRVKNSPLCKQYIKMYGMQKAKENDFLTGFCCGLGEAIFDENLIGTKINCVVEGHDCCVIEVKKGSKKIDSAKDELFKKLLEDFHKDTSPDLTYKTTLTTQKILGHNLMMFKDGMFAVFYTPGIILSTAVYMTLYKLLFDKFDDDIDNILYCLGEAQGRGAVDIQVERFGKERDSKFFTELIGQMEFMGNGRVNIDKLDFKNKHVVYSIKNNPLPEKCLNLFGKQSKPCGFYLTGLLTGAAEGLFQKELTGVETECRCEGNKKCVIEVKEKNKWESKKNLPVHRVDMDMVMKYNNVKAYFVSP